MMACPDDCDRNANPAYLFPQNSSPSTKDPKGCRELWVEDGVDLGNARNGFGGDRRIAALGDLEELASQVAPAKGDCDPVRGQLLDGA